MPESLRTRVLRWRFNFFPAYRGTGARITYIDRDFREVRIRLPLSWRTKNYVGTIFGGSMYAAVDPIYMVMLLRRLGSGYEVWDKAASIRFRRPGRDTLYATFRLEDEEVEAIRAAIEARDRVDRRYDVNLVDGAGVLHAEVEKVVHVRRKGLRKGPGSKGPVPESERPAS